MLNTVYKIICILNRKNIYINAKDGNFHKLKIVFDLCIVKKKIELRRFLNATESALIISRTSVVFTFTHLHF